MGLGDVEGLYQESLMALEGRPFVGAGYQHDGNTGKGKQSMVNAPREDFPDRPESADKKTAGGCRRQVYREAYHKTDTYPPDDSEQPWKKGPNHLPSI